MCNFVHFLRLRRQRWTWKCLPGILSFIKWASSRENLSSGVCEQHRRRPACASAQSDQRLCYSLFEMYYMLTCYRWNFNFLASLCSWGDLFETRFVGNPEDRFSRVAVQMLSAYLASGIVTCWDRADLLALLYVMLSCVLSRSHMVFWVRCGIWLYVSLIFAFFFTLISDAE